MTDAGLRPRDAEMIAAFIDRQLSDRERRDLLERLDREQALYEVFVETVRHREAMVDEATAVIEHPAARGRRSWALPASIAALLALAVGLALWFRGGVPGRDPVRELVADGRLAGRLAPDWTEPGWSRTRGLTGLEMSETDRAFRVGVHALDLEVALRLGRTEDAVLALRGVERALGAIDLSEPLGAAYGEIRERLEAGANAGEALASVHELGPLTAEFLDLDAGYAFGRWAETGKLAALAGNRKLLTSRRFRASLRELRAQTWTDRVEGELALIAAELDRRAEDLDLDSLATAFTAVIDET